MSLFPFSNAPGATKAQVQTFVPVTAYGAKGDGSTDDLSAINAALAANKAVYFPPGTYRVSAPVVVPANSVIEGAGIDAVVKADNNTYDVFQINQSYTTIKTIKTLNGLAGFRYVGLSQPVVENALEDVVIDAASYGLVLDGGNSSTYPCYWNTFSRVLVTHPAINGIFLTKSGAGDTPNTNRFHSCRVYSLGADISGDGIYVQYGNYNNSFVDCEVNVKTTAPNCIHIGANATRTILINPTTETSGSVTNIILDSGSSATVIMNHHAASAGTAIIDNSGGAFLSFNAPTTTSGSQSYVGGMNIGYPVKKVANTLNSPFQIHGLDSNTANSSVFIYRNNNVGARISLNKCRSTTLGNNGLVSNNDQCGYLDFNGNDNSNWIPAASVWGVVDATVTAGSGICPGRVQLMTANASGSLTEGMRVDSKQNVVHGTAAISTSATDGFTYIATCAGAPTGVPTSYTGRVPMVYDTTNNKFWIYNGSWKGTVLS